LKLLVSQMHALGGYVSREFFYIMEHLVRKHGWRHAEQYSLWERPGTLEDKLLGEVGEIPEVILFWETYRFCATFATELANLDCRLCMFADDLHSWHEEMRSRKHAVLSLADTILATYEYALEEYFPALKRQKHTAWIPHSASPDFMLPYNASPENAILLSGKIDLHYPLRQRMKALYDEHRYRIAYHEHPGYHCHYDYGQDQNVGESYAKKINRCRVAFTDCMEYGYVVAKHFEIPAVGALLLAEDRAEGPLRDLGFMKGIHYLQVSAGNLEDRVRYVLDEANTGELDEIRKRGMELVLKQHKTTDRARQLDEACTSRG
jgi:glycosyl transferase family 1